MQPYREAVRKLTITQVKQLRDMKAELARAIDDLRKHPEIEMPSVETGRDNTDIILADLTKVLDAYDVVIAHFRYPQYDVTVA